MIFTGCLPLVESYSLMTPALFSHKNISFVKFALEHDMILLMNWYKANKLSLNIEKTVLMKYWPDTTKFTIDIAKTMLTNDRCTKFLGVFIDDKLECKEHANKVINKINVNKKLLLNSQNILDKNSLRNIYHAHIYSHLMCGLVVWGSMLNNKDKDTINKIQKQCMRYSTKSSSKMHTNPLYKRMRTLMFPDMIKLELAKLGHKIMTRQFPTPILDLFHRSGVKNNIDTQPDAKTHLTYRNMVKIFSTKASYVKV